MRDPYDILGVSRTASDEDIKKAYRKLAKELHPDLHPDDPQVTERFKEVSAAYKLVGDPDQRRKYDQGEVDANGQARSGFRYEYAGAGPRPGGGGNTFDFSGINPEDIFGEFFSNLRGNRRGQGGQAHADVPHRGADRSYKITVDFLDAAQGSTRRINLPSGKMLDVKIPAGIADGKQIRLKGQGHPGINGGPAGDALIEVSVREHPYFRLDGHDIRVDVPISIDEAVLGAKIEVPTIDGKVSMAIPKNASSGRTMRLKGKGIVKNKSGERGDQYVTLSIVLPGEADAELEKAVAKWSKSHHYNVRSKLFDD
jgi:DnaJ-class molecular chaperone